MRAGRRLGAAAAGATRAGARPCAREGTCKRGRPAHWRFRALGLATDAGSGAAATATPLRRTLPSSLSEAWSRWSPFGGRDDSLVTGELSVLADKYELLDELGIGRFGVVRRARRVRELTPAGTPQAPAGATQQKEEEEEEEEELFAVKSMRKGELEDLDEMRNELDILRRLDHPHVMGMVEAVEDEEYLHIVSPLCTGGELFDRIVAKGSFSEADAATLMRQLLLALEYCHDNVRIVHRDIKPENLLFRTSDAHSALVLCDFGMSHMFRNGSGSGGGGDGDGDGDGRERLHATCGSPSYVAPEVLRRSYTEKCDVWSAGVIMHILLSGNVPFGGETDDEIMRNVARAQYSLADDAVWSHVSASAKGLLRGMLQPDPARRLSAADCLAHRWVAELGLGRRRPLALAFENIRRWNKHAKLKKLALHAMALRLALCSEQELRDQYLGTLRAIFARLDANGDGHIDAEALAEAILAEAQSVDSFNVLAASSSAAELAAVLRDADANQDGTIDLPEFFAAALSESDMLNEENLRHAFDAFDADGDGCISLDELRSAAGRGRGGGAPGMGKGAGGAPDKGGGGAQGQEDRGDDPFDALERDFHAADLNGDGRLQYSEFIEAMKR